MHPGVVSPTPQTPAIPRSWYTTLTSITPRSHSALRAPRHLQDHSGQPMHSGLSLPLRSSWVQLAPQCPSCTLRTAPPRALYVLDGYSSHMAGISWSLSVSNPGCSQRGPSTSIHYMGCITFLLPYHQSPWPPCLQYRVKFPSDSSPQEARSANHHHHVWRYMQPNFGLPLSSSYHHHHPYSPHTQVCNNNNLLLPTRK